MIRYVDRPVYMALPAYLTVPCTAPVFEGSTLGDAVAYGPVVKQTVIECDNRLIEILKLDAERQERFPLIAP